MKLYLVPTPIGNLSDITFRAVEVLKSVDYIACEDTRVSGKLLMNYGIKAKLISHYVHNEKKSCEKIIELIKSGSSVAYISDAGMPAISDPGKALVLKAIKNNLDYTILPGASASTCAYAASKFEDGEFYFVGFVDRKNRKSKLDELSHIKAPIIFYESPHRIEKFLDDLLEVFGDRDISVLREISKMYESYIHGSISELLLNEEIKNPKGEFVVVVDKYIEKEVEFSDEEIISIAKNRLNDGEKLSDIAKDLSKITKYKKNEIYKMIIEI